MSASLLIYKVDFYRPIRPTKIISNQNLTCFVLIFFCASPELHGKAFRGKAFRCNAFRGNAFHGNAFRGNL